MSHFLDHFELKWKITKIWWSDCRGISSVLRRQGHATMAPVVNQSVTTLSPEWISGHVCLRKTSFSSSDPGRRQPQSAISRVRFLDSTSTTFVPVLWIELRLWWINCTCKSKVQSAISSMLSSSGGWKYAVAALEAMRQQVLPERENTMLKLSQSSLIEIKVR